jgi:hypothetical protein
MFSFRYRVSLAVSIQIVLRNAFPKYGRFLPIHPLYLTRIHGVICHKTVTLHNNSLRRGIWVVIWVDGTCYERVILIYRQLGEAYVISFPTWKEKKKNVFCWCSYEDEYLRASQELGLFCGQIGVHSSGDQSPSLWRPEWTRCRLATGLQYAVVKLVSPQVSAVQL